MIYTTSRYNDGPLVDIIEYTKNVERKVVFRLWPTRVSEFAIYVWKQDDRLDHVAQKFYGSSAAWWQIMDYNPEIVDPTSITPGTEIRLPS